MSNKALRQTSQPALPNLELISDKENQRIERKRLPLIKPKTRLDTPGYVGVDAYDNFYK